MSEPFDITIQWVTTEPASCASLLARHVAGHLPTGVRLVVHGLKDLLGGDPARPVPGPNPLLVLELTLASQLDPASTMVALSKLMPAHLSLVLVAGGEQDLARAWLNAGADRCLGVDTDERLIMAMVRSMLRRVQGHTTPVSVHGPLKFDHDSRTLYQGDQRIVLTLRETQVANLLFHQGTQLVKPEQILRALGMRSLSVRQTGLVSLYVHRVNRKIRRYGVYIEFLRNYGYRLSVDPLGGTELPTLPWPTPLTNRALASHAREAHRPPSGQSGASQP